LNVVGGFVPTPATEVEMPSWTLTRKELRDLLIRNWMTHDGLWYGEVALRFGMGEASPMNRRVCRRLGQIEFRRLMALVGAAPPRNMAQYEELFEFGRQIYVPDVMEFNIEYPSESEQVFHVLECVAHRAMEKAGQLEDYECGIFERIEGWFDAMGVKYTRTPNLDRCLKMKGEACSITVKFFFE
jgi:hypothetical protein